MVEDGPSEGEYLAQLRRLGLRPTGFGTERSTVYSDGRGGTVSVARPERLSPRERREQLDKIRALLGIGLPGYKGPH